LFREIGSNNKQKLYYAKSKELILNEQSYDWDEWKEWTLKKTGLCREERSDL
jgi:hypothetical protein